MTRVGAPPLLRRFPSLEGVLPWRSLGHFPTPLERVALPGAGEFWVKRDDLTAESYGGNKVRKLEFLIADAVERGAGRLITAGALGSHHALATAVHGRVAGLPVTLVLFPQHVTGHVRRVLLADVAFGAELSFVPRMELVPAALAARRWAHRPEAPYVIPPGGSNALGTLGYVNAALELVEQVKETGAPWPTELHVAAGTLGTAAGIAIGLALDGWDARVAATRITGRVVTNERVLRSLIRGALALLAPATGLDVESVARRVELRHGQIGAGYGRETQAGREATALFGGVGLSLDPTYTAKAAAELLESVRAGRAALFWHTLSATEPELGDEGELIRRLPERFRRLLRGA